MDEAVIKILDSLPNYTRLDAPKKVEKPKADEEKPKKKKKKSK